MHWKGQFFNMNSPPQFWGASNSNWQRKHQMDPAQKSTHSRGTNDSGRSTSRRTGGPPDIFSQCSFHSGRSISRRTASRRTGGPPDDSPSNFGHSIASMTSRTRQVAKPRNSLSEKIQWDGQCFSFRPYKLAITGHLLQNGAAYLVDHSFHLSYSKYSKVGEDYLESEDFRVTYPDVTIKQARIDKTYLYGMLMSSNRKDGKQKIILKYETSQDGIAAWIEFIRDYDNNGSEEVRATKLENLVSMKYSYKYPGGFLKYIDTLQANLNELDILLPGQYSESHKKRILFRNIKEIKTLKHLIQSCKDREMSYQEAATYLRIHGAELDEEDQDTRKKNQVEKEVGDNYLSYEDTRSTYVMMAEEHGARNAFKVLNSSPRFRESLNIHYKIWKRLSEEIQNKIRKIREEVKEENKKEQSTPASSKNIPPQYGLTKKVNKSNKDDDVERLAAVMQSYHLDNETFSDSDKSDQEDDVRMGGMVLRLGENIEVQANIEYERRIPYDKNTPGISYALCDSGADSCVVGNLAKIENYTGRTANLVGYDPLSTQSNSLPIVTAVIKNYSINRTPVLL